MTEPRRLIDGDAPGAGLLSAARAYRPSPAARRRVRLGLGLPPALSFGATLSAALAATSTSTKVLLVAAGVAATAGGGVVAYRAATQRPAAALQRIPEAKRLPAPAAPPAAPSPMGTVVALPDPSGTAVAMGTTDPSAAGSSGSPLPSVRPRRVASPASPSRAPRERLTSPVARRRAAVPPAPPPAPTRAIAPLAPPPAPTHAIAPPAAPPAPTRAIVPVASPPAPPDPLAAELALLESAESALRQRRFGAALARLQEHRQAFPDSALGEEAAVLRIAALFGANQRARATAEAERFLTRAGGSLLADRVRSMLAAHPDSPDQPPPKGAHP